MLSGEVVREDGLLTLAMTVLVCEPPDLPAERRLRAARLAGIAEIPAIVCTYAETEGLKIALLENIQREDLGPVEEAEAYRDLMQAYGATQEELAGMVGALSGVFAAALLGRAAAKAVKKLDEVFTFDH